MTLGEAQRTWPEAEFLNATTHCLAVGIDCNQAELTLKCLPLLRFLPTPVEQELHSGFKVTDLFYEPGFPSRLIRRHIYAFTLLIPSKFVKGINAASGTDFL